MLGFNLRSLYLKIGLCIFIFSSKIGPASNPMRQQDFSPSVKSRQSTYQAPNISESAQIKPTPHTGFSQMGQQSSYRPPNPTHQYSHQPRPLPAPVPAPSRPSAPAAQPQNNSWKFTNSFGPQKSPNVVNRSTNQPKTARQTKTQVEKYLKKNIYNNIQRFENLPLIVVVLCA